MNIYKKIATDVSRNLGQPVSFKLHPNSIVDFFILGETVIQKIDHSAINLNKRRVQLTKIVTEAFNKYLNKLRD